ncbi:MAG: putative toxin-antitoxin system toxin component, PIN family [Synergistaceae bacterium]|nr:putative toxin-antitoxin system toxin component, PIN family [Synergistaceae bacterium]MBQ3346083.1 putative toxin-antitoxin system toxin component, PIN family [Synergistaceae bacterium]MBQ3398429.1 putative toxin-antitoxin system toxin component, PIN family [Synergistaceae bacterium]MBQ3758351.1 putative toxin-antitoxin system toxin component, PIN family [Synergistaceae bacterium]MBQ4402184.1 putative toxin-antitoxin system toxin component, PIN family [Synergistaceae bacterium]
MRVFTDTNILISSALWPNSVPARAFDKATLPPNRGVICEQNLDELIRTYYNKFQNRHSAISRFLFKIFFSMEFIPLPEDSIGSEKLVRDVKDRPLLRAAINAGVDILLTGDKDFLESGITNPRIMSASEFLKLEQ